MAHWKEVDVLEEQSSGARGELELSSHIYKHWG